MKLFSGTTSESEKVSQMLFFLVNRHKPISSPSRDLLLRQLDQTSENIFLM
jgi:hypothetical protein